VYLDIKNFISNYNYTETKSIRPSDSDIVRKNRIREWINIKLSTASAHTTVTFMFKRFNRSKEQKQLHPRRPNTTDCIISIRGLQNYKNDLYLVKHKLMQQLYTSFANKVIITRLDIAFDFRPNVTNTILHFDKFQVKRKNKRYSSNPNQTKDTWETQYIERNVANYEDRKMTTSYFSKYYNKNLEAFYPYSILRFEIALNVAKLKQLGITTIDSISSDTVTNIIHFIKKNQYCFEYDKVNININYDALSTYLLWFSEFVKNKASYTPYMLRAYAKQKDVIGKKHTILRLYNTTDKNIGEIARTLDIDREFVGRVISAFKLHEKEKENILNDKIEDIF